MAASYELKKSSDGQFMFNLKAANGEVVLTSERYVAKQKALEGIAAVKKNSPSDSNYERKTSAGGKAYFVLMAGNKEMLGTSEEYSSVQARDKGIEATKAAGPTAAISDQTISGEAN